MNCRLCLGPHDPEIHGATARVRQWFRKDLMRRLTPVAIPKRKSHRRKNPNRNFGWAGAEPWTPTFDE